MSKLILFDQETGNLSWVNCEDLDDFYKHLDCRCFDIVSAHLNDLDVYCDDEGLLVQKELSAVMADGQPLFVGNLIFARHDEEGETVDCTEDDMYVLKSRVLTAHNATKTFKVIRLGAF